MYKQGGVTMNLKEFQDKYGNQEVNEVELKKLLGIKENKVWKPKRGDFYWFINQKGEIANDGFIPNVYYDKWNMLSGNYFKTKEEAEWYREHLIVTQELKEFALENNECEINWENYNQKKWVINYDYTTKQFEFLYTRMYKNLGINFTSKELCVKAIETIGSDRIKKYYLGVI